MKISLCMIVKNEEEYIKQCLDSVLAVVNEIIIVDTGSTDGTLEIISREFKDHVTLINYKWNNDFAEARNIALKHATGDWILIMDADEKLMCDLNSLHKCLLDNKIEFYNITTYNFLSTGAIELSTCTIRIFKNNGAKYVGAIHEQLHLNDEPVKTAILDENVCKLLHYGYLKSEIKRKDKMGRNTSLIQSEIDKDPQNPFSWYNLGVMCMINEKYDKAIDNFIKSHNLCNGKRHGFMNNMMVRMTQCLLMQKQYDSCINFIERILKDVELIKVPDLHYYLGLIYKDKGHYDKALMSFDKCIEIGEVVSGVSQKGMGSYLPMLEVARINILQGYIQEGIMRYMEAIFNGSNYSNMGVEELKPILINNGMIEVLDELTTLTSVK